MMAFGGFDQAGGNFDERDQHHPLVDVMLVLLIIFMITAPLMTHAVKSTFPGLEHPAEDKPETISLSVDAEGLMFWNDAPLDKSALEQRLAKRPRSTPNPSCIFGRIARPLPDARRSALRGAPQRRPAHRLRHPARARGKRTLPAAARAGRHTAAGRRDDLLSGKAGPWRALHAR